MFRRKWSSLPADPQFPLDLEELGYFVNKDDEIRSIEDPDFYFKFFLTRNDRHNDRQRFALNIAVQKIVHHRLEKLGLKKTLLPLCPNTTPETPHVPIFVSAGIESKTRVVVIFGETTQDLGILAHRVLGGVGGVDKGSMVSVVRHLLREPSSPGDKQHEQVHSEHAGTPGIILANMGQLFWWPEGHRALNPLGVDGAPRKSAVHHQDPCGLPENVIPDNSSHMEHVSYIFEKVLPKLVTAPNARVDLLVISDSAEFVESYLDRTWDSRNWENKLNCMAIVGSTKPASDLLSPGLRGFLRHKARAYTISPEPAGIPLSGPDGNDFTSSFTDHGCPVFSVGESKFVERLLVVGHPEIVDFFNQVASAPGGSHCYRNPVFQISYRDEYQPDEQEEVWGEDWEKMTAEKQETKEQDVKENSPANDQPVPKIEITGLDRKDVEIASEQLKDGDAASKMPLADHKNRVQEPVNFAGEVSSSA